MNLTFTPEAWEDCLHWQKTDNRITKRIHQLIKEIQRSPFEGIGKPEALRHNLSGCWSRRITEEHRIVYTATEDGVAFLQMRYHY
ncbi:Txe/YoeB family addiction module toxin [Pelagicoccus sp. SDUM812002]|uniref:Txe/YoeB family addiction module toxin n=1 Tax=Pelagicoccus sp. SDUM812002 TaxID=3041266 RepID=UPI00280EAD9F|nr:Txe/YoeB family addiction module toxin [Pelagicoccus sp. SDUM812002]MDQ8187135.1 Txe/YoeB family addiction module toxin [Pelagicoccus sp. SDUM812002]